MNYIKGFRYEIFCLIRGARTSHCVIFVDNSLEMCLKMRNEKVERMKKEENVFI